MVEERGIEKVLGKKYPLASTVASFVARTGNTFVGSLLWVDFIRLMGLQKQKAPAAVDPKGKKGAKPAATKAKAEPKKAAAAKKADPKKADPKAAKVAKK